MQLLNLIFGIVTSRILNDTDYGMIGMLSIFSLIAASLQESGFTSALANKKEIRHEDYNAVFWFSSAISVTLYLILFFCAPLIADFYDNENLIPLARYAFLGFVISSLGISQNAYLFRNLMVKQKTIASISGLAVSGIVGIIMACLGCSYWSIATQSIVYISVLNICLWSFSPWRPTLKFSFKPLKGMVNFSAKLMITNIFNHINNNLFSIILGKYYSEKEVGQFNQANKWNYMGHSFISSMVGSVAQPMFNQVGSDQTRQQRVFRKMLRFTAFIAFPSMLIIVHRSRTDYDYHHSQMATKRTYPANTCNRWRIYPHYSPLFKPYYQQREIQYLHVEYHHIGHPAIDCHADTQPVRTEKHADSLCGY